MGGHFVRPRTFIHSRQASVAIRHQLPIWQLNTLVTLSPLRALSYPFKAQHYKQLGAPLSAPNCLVPKVTPINRPCLLATHGAQPNACAARDLLPQGRLMGQLELKNGEEKSSPFFSSTNCPTHRGFRHRAGCQDLRYLLFCYHPISMKRQALSPLQRLPLP